MNNRYFIIPFLVTGYFFVHFSLDYYYFLQPVPVAISILKYLIAVSAIYLAGYFFFRNKEKYILAFSSILFIFLFFGSITDTAAKYKLLNPNTRIYIKPVLIFLISTIVILLLVRVFNKTTTRKFLLFWTVYCTALIIYDSATFIFHPKKEKTWLVPSPPVAFSTGKNPPEIFYLVFDMYTSDTIYKKYFGFDNSAFSSFLREKDFYVTGNANALYYETYFSLSSSLNLETFSYDTDSSVEKYKKVLLSIQRLQQPSLPASFVKAGYTFWNFSVFNILGQPSPLHYNLNFHLDNILTSNTFFNRVYNELEPDFLLAEKDLDVSFFKRTWSENVEHDLQVLDSNFNRLLNAGRGTSPGFNYFHYMIPHPPLLYDSNGNKNAVKDRYFFNDYENAVARYTSYTTYGNKKIMGMVNRIFEKEGKNVIIIIQGDHGFRGFNDKLPGEVRLGIQNAVYLPNRNYSNFNDTMTPIFTFRQIIKNQFGY